MSIQEALETICEGAGLNRTEAIRTIFDRPNFEKPEIRLALEMIESWPASAHASGAIYYVLEISGHSLGLWPNIDLRRRIALSLSEFDFDVPLWSGGQFLVWWCAEHEKRALRSLGMAPPKKASRISPYPECLTNLKYCIRMLNGMDDFSDVCDELLTAFTDRATFHSDEIRLARECIGTLGSPWVVSSACTHVLVSAWGVSEFDAWLSRGEVSPETALILRDRLRKNLRIDQSA